METFAYKIENSQHMSSLHEEMGFNAITNLNMEVDIDKSEIKTQLHNHLNMKQLDD